MPGAHDIVCRLLVGISNVAGFTQLRAVTQVGGWIHSLAEVTLIGGFRRRMTRNPAFRAAMTGLATDSVRQRKLGAALRGSDIVRMTVQTLLGALRRRQPKLRRDRPSALTRQGLECLGVRVLMRPGDEFVEQNVVIGIGRDRAVAQR